MSDSNKIVVIVNGPPTSGKDTFCEIFNNVAFSFNKCSEIVSSVGAVKQAAEIMGWSGTKTPEERKALSDLKLISEKLWDGPNKYMLMKARTSICDVVFVHIRELRNIDKFIELCKEAGIGVRTLYIHRKGEVVTNNEGDRDAYDVDYPYQSILDNNGTLEDLESKANSYFQYVFSAPNAEQRVLSLTEEYKNYAELIEAAGNEFEVKKILAEYLGAKFLRTETYEHPHSGREGEIDHWSVTRDFDSMPFANVGIFNFEDFNVLMKLAHKSSYEGTIYINDVRKTYEHIAVHIANLN